MNKQQMQKHFDRASHTYPSVASIQKTCAHTLVSYMTQQCPTFVPHNTLDLGTGTGFVTQELISLFPHCRYTLNDVSASMLEASCHTFGHKACVFTHQGDMETSLFDPHDLVISNFALQWVSDLHSVIQKMSRIGHVVAFSCLLKGTFSLWENLITAYGATSPLTRYPCAQSVQEMLCSLPCKKVALKTHTYDITFRDARHVITYLKTLGANTTDVPLAPHRLKHFLTTYTNPITLTYNVLFCVLRTLS